MWFQKTRLFPAEELSPEDRAQFEPSIRLDDHYEALGSFALGDSSIEIASFMHHEAQFVDIYATVRKFRPTFRPEHVLGLEPHDIVVTDAEGRGFWDSFIFTTWLTKPATPRRPERHIVWTSTWHQVDSDWLLIGSHASAHN